MGTVGRCGSLGYTDLSASIFHIFRAAKSKGTALKLALGGFRGEVIKALRREKKYTQDYSPILPRNKPGASEDTKRMTPVDRRPHIPRDEDGQRHSNAGLVSAATREGRGAGGVAWGPQCLAPGGLQSRKRGPPGAGPRPGPLQRGLGPPAPPWAFGRLQPDDLAFPGVQDMPPDSQRLPKVNHTMPDTPSWEAGKDWEPGSGCCSRLLEARAGDGHPWETTGPACLLPGGLERAMT